MAANFSKTFEFKVKAQDLTRAVDRIFKDVKRIEASVARQGSQWEKVRQGLGYVYKEVKQVNRELNNTEKALARLVTLKKKLGDPQGLAKSFVAGGFGALLNNPGKIAKLAAKLGVVDAAVRVLSGRTKGLGTTLTELAGKALNARSALESYSVTIQKLIGQHPVLTAQLVGLTGGLDAVSRYTPQVYNLGKAFRQLTADISAVDKAGRAGGIKNILRMFPKGSILGGLGRSGDISGLKFKDLEKQQKQVERAAAKTAVKYKEIATGLNKLREELAKIKKIQDQLLSSSKGYENVSKKVLNLQREIAKEEKKRAAINKRIDWKGGLTKLLSENAGKIAKAIAKLGVADAAVRTLTGRTKGLGQTLLDLGKKVLSARTAMEGYSTTLDRLIRQHPILTAKLVGLAGGLAAVTTYAPQVYNLGKAFRQLTADVLAVDKAGRAGGIKNILRMFPAGSILGGIGRSGDISGLKFKDLEKEQRKLEKAAEKTAYKYKEAATGLSKLREQLEKSRRIQDKLLAGSDRYLKIAKNTLRIEREIVKEERKRASINRRLTWTKDLMKSLGGQMGIAKLIAGGIGGGAGLIGLDQAVRKLSKALGQQINLYQAVTKGADGFFKALGAINKAVGGALNGLDKYGRQLFDIINSHQRLIQSTVGVISGLDAVGRYTPQIYAAGKAWRQLEYDIRRVGKAFADSGFRGVGALFPKGSMIGRWGRGMEAGAEPFPGEKIDKAVTKAQLKDWRGMGEHPGNIRAHVDGLNRVRGVLESNRRIQENINTFTKANIQAVVATRKAQTAVNHELLRAKLTQAAFTSDIWLAKKGWQALVGTIKGIGGVFGKILGTQVGKEAAVIGLSKGVEALITKIPFLDKKWSESIASHAHWVAKVTEGISVVRLAYAGLSKVLGGADWVVGAISGFVTWEKQAALSFQRVNQMRVSLDKDLAKWLDRGVNPWKEGGKAGGPKRLSLWDRLMGRSLDEETGVVKERFADELGTGPQTRLDRQNAALKEAKLLRDRLPLKSKELEAAQKRVFQIERQINKEIKRREGLYSRANVEAAKRKVVQLADDVVSAQQNLEKAELAHTKNVADIKLKAEDALFKRKMENEQRLFEKEMKNKAEEFKSGPEGTDQWDRRLARADKRRRTNERLRENLMLGAGFPLLFGGGLGAVGGGVLGAGLQAKVGSEGGFGMQILFSALGQQLDAIASKAVTTAKAFTSLDGAFNLMNERSLWSSEAVKEKAEALQKEGKNTELATLLTKEYTKILGSNGIKRMQELGEKAKQAAQQWGILRTQLEMVLSGPLTEIMKWLNKFLALGISKNTLRNLHDNLIRTGQEDRASELRGAVAGMQSNSLRRNRNLYGKRLDLTGISQDEVSSLVERFNPFDSKSTASIPATGGKDGTTGTDLVSELNAEIALLKELGHLSTREAAIRKEIKELGAEENTDLKEKVRLKYKLQAQSDLLKSTYDQIGGAIKDGMVDAIQSAIDGTKTLGEVAASVFRQISNMLINYGISQAFGPAGLNWLPGRAAGGPVTGGNSYLVGEKGPEIFTPGKSGNITPNNQLGGTSNVTINVDAGGSSMQGNAEQAGQLGRMLAAAVQDEMARQKRPGGLLYR